VTRPPLTAQYWGGPAHGKVEHICPTGGESLDVRYFPVPPPVEVVATAAPTPPEPVHIPVAEYRLVHGEFLHLGERDAFVRGVAAGRHLVFGVYEYERTT